MPSIPKTPRTGGKDHVQLSQDIGLQPINYTDQTEHWMNGRQQRTKSATVEQNGSITLSPSPKRPAVATALPRHHWSF